jgi:hypothetical protein
MRVRVCLWHVWACVGGLSARPVCRCAWGAAQGAAQGGAAASRRVPATRVRDCGRPSTARLRVSLCVPEVCNFECMCAFDTRVRVCGTAGRRAVHH